LEIEAKFSIPDERVFQRLLETTVLSGYPLGDASEAEIHDRYLDTADRSIHEAGYACRLRRTDGRYLATLKGLGSAVDAIHRRTEFEVELAGDLPPRDWPPGKVRDLVFTFSQGKPLQTLFEIEQKRHTRVLRDGERSVAGLNLDRVRVRPGDTIADAYLEFELELLPDGSEEEIRELSVELQARWDLVPQNLSKFERGLALLGATEGTGCPGSKAPGIDSGNVTLPARQQVELLERPGIQPDDPMSEAGRKTFRFHFRRMLYHEPGTRLGEDIEALHDMRVATRRMRAAFRVFGDHFDAKAIAPHLKGLKRTGRALGRVRDLDVFRERTEAYLATLSDSERHSLDGLLAAQDGRREAAREKMIDYLDGKKYRRFVEGFGEFVETEGMGSLPVAPNGGEPRPYRVCHVAPVTIYQRLAAVRAYDEWVSIPDPPLTRLHSLRIACKRLRYTLEFFSEVLGSETKTVIKEVVTIQDHLGALQDAVVASSILQDLLTSAARVEERASQPQMSAPGMEAYLANRQAALRQLVDTFPSVWAPIKRMEFSQMIADALTCL
jgi:CHAD domain-containing protein